MLKGILLAMLVGGVAMASSTQWQEDAQVYSAIVQSAAVGARFGNYPNVRIDSVTRNSDGTYSVAADGCGFPVGVSVTYTRSNQLVIALDVSGQMLCSSKN